VAPGAMPGSRKEGKIPLDSHSETQSPVVL
jgi:hypothetical protein